MLNFYHICFRPVKVLCASQWILSPTFRPAVLKLYPLYPSSVYTLPFCTFERYCFMWSYKFIQCDYITPSATACSAQYHIVWDLDGTSGKDSACQRRCKRHESHPRVRKVPWRREWQPTPVFLPGKPMDRGAWWATVHETTRSWTWLSTHSLLSMLKHTAGVHSSKHCTDFYCKNIQWFGHLFPY